MINWIMRFIRGGNAVEVKRKAPVGDARELNPTTVEEAQALEVWSNRFFYMGVADEEAGTFTFLDTKIWQNIVSGPNKWVVKYQDDEGNDRVVGPFTADQMAVRWEGTGTTPQS